MLAGVGVAKLMDQDDKSAHDPQGSDICQPDVLERIRRRQCRDELGPAIRQQAKVKKEQRDRCNGEPASEHPANGRHCSRESCVWVAERPSHPQQLTTKERLAVSLCALGAQSLELQGRSLGDAALEKTGVR